MAASPYNLWSTRRSLGVMRDIRAEDHYFAQFYTNQMRSTTEWIDFEKLPIRSRRMAPFVKPKARGRGLPLDRVQGFRFKPANIVLEDAIDPERPLTYEAGIDGSAFDAVQMSPMQRLEAIKASTLADYDDAMERRWEWMRARAIIDGEVTIVYEDGETVVVDFNRAAGHTETLGLGDRYGDSGVSILDHWQLVMDTMNDAEFGGMVTKITMGGSVAPIVRNDVEILKHLDINIKGGTVTVERGIVGGGPNGGKVYKFGELLVGGNSGQKVELWVNNETYEDDAGSQQRYLGAKEVVFTSTPEAIKGYECFGRIMDRDAGYEALPKFPKNFEVRNGRVVTEHLSMESAPLFVPVNPNATYKATVLA